MGSAKPDLEQEIYVKNYVKHSSQTLLTMKLLRLEKLYFKIKWLQISLLHLREKSVLLLTLTCVYIPDYHHNITLVLDQVTADTRH